MALAGASLIAVTPVVPPPLENHLTSAEVRLAASSVLNIPINVIQDVINTPYNEVQGINALGQSLLFTGTWLVAGSTNIWGTDPADTGHYGLVDLFPFPAFSNSVAAQVSGLAAVLLPINSGCNNVDCPNPFALVAGWFQPARIWTLLTTGQYTFDAAPVTGPDGTTHPPEGLWSFGGPVTWGAQYGHPEWDTKTDPATGQPVVPWAGTTFTVNPLAPFSDYLTHLMSDPTSPENAIKFPTGQQTATAFSNLASGLIVDFSPIFPGSPYCIGLCGQFYGPGSLLAPPFYHDPAPVTPSPLWQPPTPPATTASLNQDSAPVGANAVSIPQGTGAQLTGRAQQNDAAQHVGVNLSTEAQSGPGGATSPGQGSGLTPLEPLNRLRLPLTGPKTPKAGTTSSTGTRPNGSLPGRAPTTGTTLRNIVTRFLPHRPGTTTTNAGTATSTTRAATSTDAAGTATSTDAPNNAGSDG